MEKIKARINETFINGTAVEKTEDPAAIVALRSIAAEKKAFTSKFFVSTQAFKSYQAVILALHSRVIQYVNATIAGEAVDTRDIAAAYHLLSVMLRLCVDDRYVSTRMCWTNGFIPRFITAAGTMKFNGEYRVFTPCSLQTFQKNVESLFLNIYDGVITVDPLAVAAEKQANLFFIFFDANPERIGFFSEIFLRKAYSDSGSRPFLNRRTLSAVFHKNFFDSRLFRRKEESYE